MTTVFFSELQYNVANVCNSLNTNNLQCMFHVKHIQPTCNSSYCKLCAILPLFGNVSRETLCK